jgi:serine protease Do
MLAGKTQHTRSSSHPALSWRTILSVGLFIALILPVAGYAQDNENIEILRRMGGAFASVAERASPGVVGITTRRTVARAASPTQESPWGDRLDPFSEEFFEFFFRRRSPEQAPQRDFTQRAIGSGFIISTEGYILTNNHLVGQADEIRVELEDGRTVPAKIVGTDPESDVAVIRVETENLIPVPLGNSDNLQVGEWVLAIGSPMGLQHTVTAGIVSAIGRRGLNIATYENFIQTDAAINVGNSGGPLINLNGQAIGINTAIVGPGGGNIGIGFAIPINMAQEIAEQLIKTGAVERGYLGVVPQDLTDELAEALGLENGRGVILAQVTEGSPAARAGLRQGDVVLQFAERDVESAVQFRNLVASQRPGTTVPMVVLRDGERQTLPVQLDPRPGIEELRGGRRTPETPPEEPEPQSLGLTVRDLSSEMAQRFGYEDVTGVIIARVEPGSEAAEKGLRPGYVIREVNRRPVKDVRQYQQAINEAIKKGGRILLLITNGQANQYVVLNPPEGARP